MKRIVTILLCAALLCALTGCGKKDAAPETTPVPETTPAPETAAPETGVSEEEAAAAAEAQAQAVVDALQRARAAHGPEEIVCVIDGREIPWDTYYYLLIEELQDFIYYTGALPEDFTMLLSGETTMEKYMKDMALAKAEYYTIAHTRAQERGLALDEETQSSITAYWERMCEAYGREENLLSAMEDACLSRETYLYLLESNELLAALMDDAYGAAGEKLGAEQVLSWAAEQGYMRVKHVLYMFSDENGQPLDEEGVAAVRQKAQDVAAELGALAEDREALLARFDELMDETEDPGSARFPEGYVFNGGMVEPFMDASRALEDYGVSGVVETDYGLHVLLRLPLESDSVTMERDSATGEYMTLRAVLANELFNDDMKRWLDETRVEWQNGFDTLDLNELFGVGGDE